MSLGLKASADGLSLDLLLGATVIATFSTSGIEAGTLIADAATAQGLTNTKKLITPDMLAKAFQGANQSLASSGYQKLPGGLIIQWGSASVSLTANTNSSQTITFPIAFPNLALHGSVNGQGTATSASTPQHRYSVESLGLSSMNSVMISPITQSRTYYWFAIGY